MMAKMMMMMIDEIEVMRRLATKKKEIGVKKRKR